MEIEPEWFDFFVTEAWRNPTRTRNEWQTLLHDPATETVTVGRNRYNEYRKILASLGWWNLEANRPLHSLDEVIEACGVKPTSKPPTGPKITGGRAR